MFDNTWLNNDGVRVGFGKRNTINADPAEVHVKGLIHEIKCDIHAADMGAAIHQRFMQVPKDSTMIRATFMCNETFDFPVAIGTGTVDNVAIILDGILTAVTPVQGDVIDCTGVLMNTMLTEDNYISGRSATVDNITVGRGQLVVEYIRNDLSDI